MTDHKDKEERLRRFVADILRPPPDISPADWATRYLVIPPPQTERPGLLSLSGCEFARDVIDDFGNDAINDSVSCFGSQVGKTTIVMAGVAYVVANDPATILWVMPGADLARSFSETRWIPVVKATEPLAVMVPTGNRRHSFKKMQQQIGGAQINFVGSNSPANLASRPARVLIMDEVDKFNSGGGSEADALNLAEQRSKKSNRAKRFKLSTPTLTSGMIWQEFLKGDQQRYFVPCPGCSRMVVLAWSKNYNVFPKTGDEAYCKWSPEAKRRDGSWDLELVEDSAHHECPHCQFRIGDQHKLQMIAGGKWRPTASAARGFVSRHLPSLYSISRENSIGRLAVKFLQAKSSLLGLQGFINGDLAEPYQSQDTLQERVELITSAADIQPDGQRIMTVDCQAKSPRFWFVVRSWSKTQTVALAAGNCDTWEELRELQLKHGVINDGVIIDSGFGARSDADVYRNCAHHTETLEGGLLAGWMPAKGFAGRKSWRFSGIVMPLHLAMIDPFVGTVDAGNYRMGLLEFGGDFFKDILERLRKGEAMPRWSASEEAASDTYWHHLDAEVKAAEYNRTRGGVTYQWRPRSRHWPNHLLDCEVMQLAAAAFFKFLDIDAHMQPARATEGDAEGTHG